MKVKNHMEDVVDHMLPHILKRFPDICECERCVADIKAVALNLLPPKYVATPIGEVYAKARDLSIQFEADVTQALIAAVNNVKKNPRH